MITSFFPNQNESNLRHLCTYWIGPCATLFYFVPFSLCTMFLGPTNEWYESLLEGQAGE